MLQDIRAVLLDMDGTIVDSDAAVERSWRTWAGQYGLSEDQLGDIHGHPGTTTVRRLLPSLDDAGVDAAVRRQHQLQYEDLDDVVAIDGAHELVATLERIPLPWAVVTSADGHLARNRLAAAALNPPLVITVDDIAEGKPSPEGYLLAAERLGVAIRRCLVVEDSAPGLQAGHAAGAVTVGVRGLRGDVAVTGLLDLAEQLIGAGGGRR